MVATSGNSRQSFDQSHIYTFQDAHTRAVLVRGGSHYYPVVDAASHWYFPNSAEMRKLTGGPHGKYMLMSDSYDRAGTVGFRCVAD